MRCERGFEQPAIAADLREAGKQIRITRRYLRAAKEPNHSLLCKPYIGFVLSIEVVGERKIRAELESLIESRPCSQQVFLRLAAPFCDEPVTAAEACPCRCKMRVLF